MSKLTSLERSERALKIKIKKRPKNIELPFLEQARRIYQVNSESVTKRQTEFMDETKRSKRKRRQKLQEHVLVDSSVPHDSKTQQVYLPTISSYEPDNDQSREELLPRVKRELESKHKMEPRMEPRMEETAQSVPDQMKPCASNKVLKSNSKSQLKTKKRRVAKSNLDHYEKKRDKRSKTKQSRIGEDTVLQSV